MMNRLCQRRSPIWPDGLTSSAGSKADSKGINAALTGFCYQGANYIDMVKMVLGDAAKVKSLTPKILVQCSDLDKVTTRKDKLDTTRYGT